jgi:hypothetical protein
MAGAAVVLLGLFWYMTGQGLHTTSDSVYYLGAAQSLRQTGSLLNPDGSLYRYWGPLYPMLLAVGESTLATRCLHGLALVGNLCLWGLAGRKLLPHSRALALPWALALSTAMMVPAAFVWSETVFALLLATYIYTLLQWCRSDHRGWLWVATLAAFFIPLQRTAGMALLAGTGGGLLFYPGRLRQWRLLLAHWAASVAGGLAWNYYAERIAGTRPDRGFGTWAKLWGSLADYGFVFLRWFLPLPATWRSLGEALFAVALPVGVALLWRGVAKEGRAEGRAENKASAGTRLLWVTALVYVLGLLLAVNMTRGATGLYDAERYAAVLSGPVLLLVLAAWPAANSPWTKWTHRAAVRVGHNARALRLPVSTDVFAPKQH